MGWHQFDDERSRVLFAVSKGVASLCSVVEALVVTEAAVFQIVTSSVLVSMVRTSWSPPFVRLKLVIASALKQPEAKRPLPPG